jgi:RNA polymerase sigma-70 factor (ECF subfamily)
MHPSESTCWTVIQAAAGSAGDREVFARYYGPVIRSYLGARWRSSPCLRDLDDAVQEVLVECFKPDGILDRADRGLGFRPFLYGAVRNVALRVERQRGQRQQAGAVDLNGVPDDDASPSRLFDRAWARVQEERAQKSGAAAVQRVELLRLRFHEGLPIRAIATRWRADAAALHHEYARARQEFQAALREVVAFHHPAAAPDLEQECANLLALLG